MSSTACGMMSADPRSAVRRPQVDIYSRERTTIVERLECGLHPHQPWRDPRDSGGVVQYRTDNAPLAHTLAAACVWLRHNASGRHDVSADLLWCIVVQERCTEERNRVASALVRAWVSMYPSIESQTRTVHGLAAVERAADIIVAQCVTGTKARAKVPVHWQIWRKMLESGEDMIWELAGRASSRVVRALR